MKELYQPQKSLQSDKSGSRTKNNVCYRVLRQRRGFWNPNRDKSTSYIKDRAVKHRKNIKQKDNFAAWTGQANLSNMEGATPKGLSLLIKSKLGELSGTVSERPREATPWIRRAHPFVYDNINTWCPWETTGEQLSRSYLEWTKQREQSMKDHGEEMREEDLFL